MDTWSEGYVSDVDYIYGYYPDLNPSRIALAFLYTGLAFPQISTACELGFGQGLSVNLHAAGSAVHWHGTDFNPSQAGFANELAQAAGSGARLQNDAFAEYCNRSDLPDFDYIGLHGVWSWVSDANRGLIVDFVRRKLKVGGVLYVSYNTLPGWSTNAPIRRLLTDYAASMNTVGEGQISRVNSALDFAGRLLDVKPAFLAANPQVLAKVNALKEQNRNYLAHEYFNQDWQPMYFSEMARWLLPAKLSFACSASFLDHVDAVHLTAQQLGLMAEIPDPVLRQTVRDYLVNQQFRKDYWVKGARRLSSYDQTEALRALRVVLVTPRAEVSLTFQGVLGEAVLTESIYAPLLDVLADHVPRTLAELEHLLASKAIGFGQLVQAVVVLCGRGQLEPAYNDEAISHARTATDRLNRLLTKKAMGSADISLLASPVTGGGVWAGRVQQIFLVARGQGLAGPDEWVRFAWKVLSAQGQHMLRDGKALESEADNLAELRTQADSFERDYLPLLRALQVV